MMPSIQSRVFLYLVLMLTLLLEVIDVTIFLSS